jgi:hypothetical protein
LTSAVKNAVFFPTQEELYVPILERYGFSGELPYCAAVLTVGGNDCDRNGAVNYARMAENIGNFITPKYPGSLVFELNGAILAVFMHYTDAMVLAAVGEMLKYGKKLLPDGDGLYWASGRQHQERALPVQKLPHRAEGDALAGEARREEGAAVAYRGLGVYRILMAVEDDEMIREYYTRYRRTADPVRRDQRDGIHGFSEGAFQDGGNIQRPRRGCTAPQLRDLQNPQD